MNKFLKVFLILTVLIGAFILRKHNYSEIPFPGDSLDEYSNTWVGLSLINIGMPVGGLGVGGYENTKYEYINVDRIFQSGKYQSPIKINWPWFDHPPMMGLVTGGFAHLKGARTFGEINLATIRKPMLVIGTGSVFLVIVLGWVLYNFQSGIIAGVLYASSPLVVIGSRMVQAENGFIPLFLLAMIMLVLYEKKKLNQYLVFAVFIAGVALLFKLSAIVIFLAIFVLISNRQRIVAIGLYLPFILLFPIFGAVYDLQTFLNVFTANSGRVYGIGPQGLFELIIKTRITNTKFFTDGSILSGWLAFAAIFERLKENKIIVAAVGSYLIIYLILGSYSHGWYALPFWPFVFLAMGKIIYEAVFTNANKLLALILMIIPIGVLISKIMPWEIFQNYSGFWRWGTGLFALSVLVLGLSQNKHVKINRLAQIGIFAVFVCLIVLNIYYLRTLNIDYWYKVN